MADVRFSADDGFDFAVRCLLGGVGAGMAEPGEVLATAATVVPGDRESWFAAWTALGARCEAIADRAVAVGHRRSASDAYLRAANYRFAGFYYVLGSADPGRHLSAWRAHRRCMESALTWWPTPVETMAVPYGEANLPVWLVRAAPGTGDGDRPLMVIHNGLGSPLSDTAMTGLVDAAHRGWHTVVFDGPGQGQPCFVDGQGPVDDWGRVGVAVLDAVLPRGGIDVGAIVVAGISDGGYLAARHAAADRRVGVLVADPGVIRPLDGALGGLPSGLEEAWSSGGSGAVDRQAGDLTPDDAFAVAKLVEQWPGHSPGEVLERLGTWDLTPHVEAIDVPVIVCDPEDGSSFPGQSAELVELLGDRAVRVAFRREEGAGLDCEIGAPALRNQRVFDRLDEIFPH